MRLRGFHSIFYFEDAALHRFRGSSKRGPVRHRHKRIRRRGALCLLLRGIRSWRVLRGIPGLALRARRSGERACRKIKYRTETKRHDDTKRHGDTKDRGNRDRCSSKERCRSKGRCWKVGARGDSNSSARNLTGSRGSIAGIEFSVTSNSSWRSVSTGKTRASAGIQRYSYKPDGDGDLRHALADATGDKRSDANRMSDTRIGDTKTMDAGLCGDCVHARRIESERGSVFWMCQLSATNPNFAKYPRLPVLSCAGYSHKSVRSNEQKNPES